MSQDSLVTTYPTAGRGGWVSTRLFMREYLGWETFPCHICGSTYEVNMLQTKQMFDFFIATVRTNTGIPDGTTIAEYIETIIPGADCLPELLRCEISWDEFSSILSLRFDETGEITDEMLFAATDTKRITVESIISMCECSNIADFLYQIIPLLSLCFGEDEIQIVWEYHQPTFEGDAHAGWSEIDWTEVIIPER